MNLLNDITGTIIFAFIFLFILKAIKPILILFETFKKDFAIFNKIKKVDIFKSTFEDTDPTELELLLEKSQIRFKKFFGYYLKRNFLDRFIAYIEIKRNEAKFISSVNFALERLFFLENDKEFQQEVLRMLLQDEKKLLLETQRFNKYSKMYVLEKFFNWFNDKPISGSRFVWNFNELIFDKATFLLKQGQLVLFPGLEKDQINTLKKTHSLLN